jgi:hypothetical protein
LQALTSRLATAFLRERVGPLPQLVERLRLELTYALARHEIPRTNLLQRVLVLAVEPQGPRIPSYAGGLLSLHRDVDVRASAVQPAFRLGRAMNANAKTEVRSEALDRRLQEVTGERAGIRTRRHPYRRRRITSQ